MIRMIKKALKWTGIIAVAVILSFVANSYVREIQEKIHEGIGWTFENVGEGPGNFIYDLNGFVFNGKGFDGERDIKHVIHNSYKQVVQVKLVPGDDAFVNNLGGQGTGFFAKVTDTHGYIVTNFHVIERKIALPINIKLEINTATEWWPYEAEIVGYDPVADIAVLRVEKKDDEPWEALEFIEDSRLDITEGDPVVVIGHGMSLPYTATVGSISYTNRFGTGPYTLHLQIDAVVNQGNSGGPVLTMDGRVAGVILSILSPGRQTPGWDGVGLAVQSEISQRSINYILDNWTEEEPVKWVPYAELPFSFKIWTFDELKDKEILDLPRKDRKMMYVDLEGIDEDSPVWEAGLQQGDVFLEINGKEIYGPMNIIEAGLHAFPGDTMTVKVKRGDEFTGYEEFEFSFILNEKDPAQLQTWLDQRNQAR